MPTIRENYIAWSSYKWPERGDEWSTVWGGTEYLWYGAIFPRIQAFLPAENILEIAPGYGRCTQFLLSFCKELIIVDIGKNCIKTCKERFKDSSHIKYYVNDGKSLDMIADNSIDFVFSWDSLVHAEAEVVSSYLKYLAVKLKPEGFGFIHHSNLGSFTDPKTGQLMVENPHWRATSMTAKLFREYCSEIGVQCISQEIIAWGTDVLNDCFSLFTRNNTEKNKETIIIEYPDFGREVSNMNKISKLYNPLGTIKNEPDLKERSRKNLLLRIISKIKKARHCLNKFP
jgi:ubiquinone/menaquinone biosynthesis C-methylase UbiE